jgi:uncharacterized membrane protein
MMDMMGGGMAVVVIFWVILGLVLLALASTALIWMVRALHRQDHVPQAPQSKPTDDLDRRYAAGELSREQYLQCKADISRS